MTQQQVDSGEVQARLMTLPLRGNARAKMQGKPRRLRQAHLRNVTGIVIGGVVVAPRASELIFPIAIAVAQRLTVDQVADSFTVYPSLDRLRGGGRAPASRAAGTIS